MLYYLLCLESHENPFLNKVCIDAQNGCSQTCSKSTFSFIKKAGNKSNFTCCLCPIDQKLPENQPTSLSKCPYDPNCMNSNVCGAYLVKLKVNDKVLDCQKCKVCNSTGLANNLNTN